MIAVIADDLTGAAEIGGLGLKYNLKIELTTTANLNSTADLLIICTDTRSMPKQEALRITEEITAALIKLKPDLIFKKIDSVLRGHIIAEVEIHLQHLGINKVLIVPANPQFGRIIKKGHYFINDQPIHLTSFAHDPEFPMDSHKVHAMLRVDEDKVCVNNHADELPKSGLIIGNCENEADLKAWVDKLDNNTLLVGGAGIFAALLESLNLEKQISIAKNTNQTEPLKLFVCGSTHDNSRQLIKGIAQINGPVAYMPIEIIALAKNGEYLFDNWANEIVSLLKLYKSAIVAIDESLTDNFYVTAADLRDKKARVIEKVFHKIAINELLIEGGSTAAAIINRLSFSKFFPVEELGPGVIKMKVDGVNNLFLTVKPGSYQWPANTWSF
jgi:uncharacterized protein YgbK (DUF1537 family)